MKLLSRESLKNAMQAGRLFCWAALYERHDFMVDLGNQKRPVREITHEPQHHARALRLPSK